MLRALMLLSAISVSSATFRGGDGGGARCWKGKDTDSADVSGDTVCLGGYLYAEYEGAPRVCTILTLVPLQYSTTFSYSWIFRRVGQPKSCVGQPDCYGTATVCSDVSDQYASKVQFYIDPAKFHVGKYEIRMYDYRDTIMARASIEVVDCSPVPVEPPVAPEAPCVVASPPLTYERVDTEELMVGWTDCGYRHKHIPAEWLEGHTCRGPSMVPEGTSFTLSCPKDLGCHCVWFITHYHCPPCSSATNGGWPGILTSEGWETGSCGPRIVTPYHYETVTYRRQLEPGETVTIGPSVAITLYMSFHMIRGVDCESLSVAHCDTSKYCMVEGGKCISNWCPARLIPKPGMLPCTDCLGQCEV